MEEDFNYGEAAQLSISDLNKAVEEYTLLRARYEDAKKFATEKHFDLKKAEGKLAEYLGTSGLDKFSVPKIGTVSRISTLQFQTPKTLDDKNALFKYIESEYGDEALTGYLSINSRTLNSFLKDEVDKKTSKGESPTIPGIAPATANVTLRFNKARN
jgi:hypothetical protein